MISAFTSAGYRVATVSEPGPAPDTPHELLPPRIISGERTAFLSFIFFVLEANKTAMPVSTDEEPAPGIVGSQ